jgi:ribonuclease inhibitor
MPVKRCKLNGRMIRSLDDLYNQLSAGLALPQHFGRNLDALWDVLSTDIEGPFEIEWKCTDDSKKSMGKDLDRAVKLLQKLEKERADFKLKITQ